MPTAFKEYNIYVRFEKKGKVQIAGKVLLPENATWQDVPEWIEINEVAYFPEPHTS